MQCNVSNLTKPHNTRKVCRYDSAVERRVFKKANIKRTRVVLPEVVFVAIFDDHKDHECTVRKPRLPWHAVGCDCVICIKL